MRRRHNFQSGQYIRKIREGQIHADNALFLILEAASYIIFKFKGSYERQNENEILANDQNKE